MNRLTFPPTRKNRLIFHPPRKLSLIFYPTRKQSLIQSRKASQISLLMYLEDQTIAFMNQCIDGVLQYSRSQSNDTKRQISNDLKSYFKKQVIGKTEVSKAIKQKAAEICAICQDYMKQGEILMTLLCTHSVHLKCGGIWILDMDNLCPLCKDNLLKDTNYESKLSHFYEEMQKVQKNIKQSCKELKYQWIATLKPMMMAEKIKIRASKQRMNINKHLQKQMQKFKTKFIKAINKLI